MQKGKANTVEDVEDEV